jgi:hypothetical protein
MLKQLVGFSRSWPALTVTLPFVVAACNPAETVSSGYVEVLPARSEDITCDAAVPGHLQLDGVIDARASVVSSEELCKSTFVRRELPAGLYSVTWRSETRADDEASAEQWTLRGPSLVSVFPGQVTRLRVRHEIPDRMLAKHEQ